MDRLTNEQRLQIIELYYQNSCSVRNVHRALLPFYGRHSRPSEQSIRKIVTKFRTKFTLLDIKPPTRLRTVRSEENIAAVSASVTEDREMSIRRRSQQLGLSYSTTRKILRKDLGVKPIRVGLQINATLENIDELETCHPDYPFFIKIKCTNCGEESDKWHDITESERSQQDSRNPDGFNFYMKCKMCSRENTIDVVEKSNVKYTKDDTGKFKTIVVFDCRGAEPTEFSPRTGWLVKSSENGQKFDNVDLSEDDWVEYDQKNNNSIGIYEFSSQFIKLKN